LASHVNEEWFDSFEDDESKPDCPYYLRGNCINKECPYRHNEVLQKECHRLYHNNRKFLSHCSKWIENGKCDDPDCKFLHIASIPNGFTKHPEYNRLKNYVQYTLKRLKEEKKILLSSDEQFAAFNTGLCFKDSHKTVFAKFKVNKNARICNLLKYVDEKELLDSGFHSVPEAAYFETLTYDPENKITFTSYDHLIDRIYRFPLKFVKNVLGNKFYCINPISKNFFKRIQTVIKNNNDVYNKFIELLQSAINTSTFDPVPFYYFKRSLPSFLYPLSLCSANIDIFLALVASNDKYVAHTVLTVNQGRNNERLLKHTNH